MALEYSTNHLARFICLLGCDPSEHILAEMNQSTVILLIYNTITPRVKEPLNTRA